MAAGCWPWSMDINSDQRSPIGSNPARDLRQSEEILFVPDDWLCKASYTRMPPEIFTCAKPR